MLKMKKVVLSIFTSLETDSLLMLNVVILLSMICPVRAFGGKGSHVKEQPYPYGHCVNIYSHVKGESRMKLKSKCLALFSSHAAAC